MADVFISYSKKHRETAEKLADFLARKEFASPGEEPRLLTVWWDNSLVSGDLFSPEITRQIDEAGAVVVIWSEGAVTSNWVYAEAMRGAAAGKLVPVIEAGVLESSVPLPFGAYHMDSAEDHDIILCAVRSVLGGVKSQHPASLSETAASGWVLEPKHEALPVAAAARRPASLLLAKHQVMPFSDIHGLAGNFTDWAISEPGGSAPPALARLLHGPGGLGKTRLMIEVCERLTRDHGWLAGFIPRDVRGPGRELSERSLANLILSGREAAGLMLVVDYAEGRQADVSWLTEKLMRRAETASSPARLVLLSRGLDWWREIIREDQNLQDLAYLGPDAYDEIAIPEAIGQLDRQALFKAAADAFTTRRREAGEPIPLEPPSDDLKARVDAEEGYDRPLAAGMAALLYASGHDAAEGRPGIAGLLNKVLGLEHAHWKKVAGFGPHSSLPQAMKNGVALATLAGDVSGEEDAASLLGQDPLYKRDSTVSQTQVLLMLQALFPAPGRGLSPLEPDLIGEHHVAQVAGSELMEAGLAWAAGNRDRRQNILTTLNRATRSEHGEAAAKPAAALEGLIQTRGGELGADLISVAVATPGQLLQLCPRLEEQVSGFELGTLAAIDRALPRYSLVLSDLCLSLAERLTELARRPGSSSLEDDDEGNVEALAVLADRLNDFGVRLLDVGRIEDALNASAEALGIHRDLSASLPDTFLPKLAANLNNIGVLFSASGRRMDALEASKEAVELRRILSTPRPDVFLRNLTTSLTNLGIALSDLGRHEEALKASEEAVGFWRSLAAARPDRFLRDLATELNNLGNRLSSLGHHEDALKASEEAVEIRRNLAASHPDAFLPNLAASLTNLGNGLHALDRREDALKASEEALGNYRTLVALRPDAFTPLLAKSLGANSQIHASDGRFVEAAGAAAEGMAVLKPLLQQSPAAFADLMRNLREAYLRYCREGELVPDQELLDGLDEVSGPAQDEST